MADPEVIVVSSGPHHPATRKRRAATPGGGRRFSTGTGNPFRSPASYHPNANASYFGMMPHSSGVYSWIPYPSQFRPRNFSEPAETIRFHQDPMSERHYSKPKSLLGTPPSRPSPSRNATSVSSSTTSTESYTQRRVMKRRHFSDTTPGIDWREQNKKFRKDSGGAAQPARSLKFSPFHNEEPVYTVETLSIEISDKCKALAQTQATLDKKMLLKRGVEGAIRKVLPDSSLHLVGSSTNGLGSNESDADFCLMLHPYRKVDRHESRALLVRLQKVLKGCAFVRKSQVIFATVPIIKFYDDISKYECDININNTVGIRNTFLLRAYQQVDERVQPLILVVKCWAKCHEVNDASQGTLSSYALALMVIHYLQSVCKPPVVPTLRAEYPDLFKDSEDVMNLLDDEPWKKITCGRSENNQCLGELFIGFFKYYSEDFKWDEEIISVRRGRTLPRNFMYEWRKKLVCIEEPFDSNNVAKAVWSLDKFNQIKMKINMAWSTLRISPTLESVLWLTCNQ